MWSALRKWWCLLCLSQASAFTSSVWTVSGLKASPQPWLLPLPWPRPPKSVWGRTWHAPYAATSSGIRSCWPACTTSANPASPGTGGAPRVRSAARSVAKSSAPSSFRPTTWWPPWWRRSGPPPRTPTSRTWRWVYTSAARSARPRSRS